MFPLTPEPAPSIVFPGDFDGVFGEPALKYRSLLEEARSELRAWPVPGEFSSFYQAIVRRAQPSFLLAPLVFLEVANACGGITERHVNFLPVVMLAMEAVAVVDDTIDSSATRSGEPTFPQRWGSRSSASCLTVLTSLIAQKSYFEESRIFDIVMEFMKDMAAKELLELHELFPGPDDFGSVLTRRHRLAADGAGFYFNCALILSGRSELSRETMIDMGRVQQDVDDLVNLLERREEAGEGDDLKLGIVTAALTEAVAVNTSLRPLIQQYWELCRYEKRLSTRHAADERIRELIIADGVPIVMSKIVQAAASCVSSTPEFLQPLMRSVVSAYCDRLLRLKTPCKSGKVSLFGTMS